MASLKVNVLKPSTHFCFFLRNICFQGLILTNLSLFILASFGTAHDKSQAAPTFCPSIHHTFAPNIDTAACDANLQSRKGSVASCGRVEAWQFLRWNSNEWPCSFPLPSMGCPPCELKVWASRGQYVGSVYALGGAILPSRSLPSTTLQQ